MADDTDDGSITTPAPEDTQVKPPPPSTTIGKIGARMAQMFSPQLSSKKEGMAKGGSVEKPAWRKHGW